MPAILPRCAVLSGCTLLPPTGPRAARGFTVASPPGPGVHGRVTLAPLRFAFLVAVLVPTAGATLHAQERVLTRAVEVRSLSVAEATSGIPVKLRGVVVFIESYSAIFLQDESSTTFFRLAENRNVPNVGDEIEIEGRTRMGLYLPGVDHSEVRFLGRRPLPPGIPARYDDLVFSRYHYQRIAVEGLVRAVVPLSGDRSLVRLAMGTNVLEARIEKPPGPHRSLVDHRVRITGLAAGLINTTRRQLIQPYVRVLDWSDVEILAPALSAAEVPQISAEELLAFRISGHDQQRVRIEGIVTATFPPDQIYLREGERAFGVRLALPLELTAGDRVTVAGFPAMDRFSGSLVDGEIVARAAGHPPAPIELPSLEALLGGSREPLSGKYDAELVSVVGVLRDALRIEGGTALLLQGSERTLQARLPDGAAVPPIGARLRITGICQVESAVMGQGFASRPGNISLRARLPGDIVVLSRPPWWTPRRLSILLAGLAGLTLLAGLWIAVLRRQVARQTAALRRRIEVEAALEERQRIAREFHDTLEQELAGVSLRLDALATRDLDHKGRSLVEASRNLVSRIQTETRDLISDLRDSAENAGDLAAALTSLVARHAAEGTLSIHFEGPPDLPSLPAPTVHDLRMIARESVHNALKHGRASTVAIQVELDATQLFLRITDNGCGFDPATATQGRRGHFGCAGIRERARKIGATVTWRSELQRGTTVEVCLPVTPARSRPPAPDASASPAGPESAPVALDPALPPRASS